MLGSAPEIRQRLKPAGADRSSGKSSLKVQRDYRTHNIRAARLRNTYGAHWGPTRSLLANPKGLPASAARPAGRFLQTAPAAMRSSVSREPDNARRVYLRAVLP